MPPVAPVIAVGVNIRHGGMVTFSVEIRFGDNALSADELNYWINKVYCVENNLIVF